MEGTFAFLREFHIYSVALRLLLAMFCGGFIGFERARKRRAAGFRTYMLVCVGSSLIMMTNQYIYQFTGSGDPMRLVTHSENNSWPPEQAEPTFIKNEDGSMTLIYDLVHTGRSVTVKQCVINISTNYNITLECKEKLSKND